MINCQDNRVIYCLHVFQFFFQNPVLVKNTGDLLVIVYKRQSLHMELNKPHKSTVYFSLFVFKTVVMKLSRTSNFIGSCWHKALVFKG